MTARKQSSTLYPIQFFMADALDHVTGLPGLAPTVTLSKNGGAYNIALGAVSEIGNGIYSLAGNAIDRNTLGELMLNAIAVGADQCKEKIDIVSYDPFVDTGSILNLLSNNASLMQLKYIKDDSLACRRASDFTASFIYLGDLTNFTKLFFTVKPTTDRNLLLDSQSTIQIEVAGGLLYINGGVAGTPANGSITITDINAGHITIWLDAAETKKLTPNKKYTYDIKRDNTVLAEGEFYVMSAITLTTV